MQGERYNCRRYPGGGDHLPPERGEHMHPGLAAPKSENSEVGKPLIHMCFLLFSYVLHALPCRETGEIWHWVETRAALIFFLLEN